MTNTTHKAAKCIRTRFDSHGSIISRDVMESRLESDTDDYALILFDGLLLTRQEVSDRLALYGMHFDPDHDLIT